MPYFKRSEAQRYYQEQGQGQPVIFIQGAWMSRLRI